MAHSHFLVAVISALFLGQISSAASNQELWLAIRNQSALFQVHPPQPTPPPPRDARTTKASSGSIKGRVTAADGRPLRRAQIRATASELKEARTVSTDTEGYYELTELQAGRYSLRVSRSGYVALSYGQRYPGELNIPLRLATGETLEDINFVLPRASVIAGRVLDELGEPIADVSVYAMQSRYFQGRRRIVPMTTLMRTDDTGQYRIVGLTPGEYYVMATTRESWVVIGRDKQRSVMAFAPTYYPGALNITTAQRLKVGLGQEIAGIDFSMVVGRSATVKGVALMANGAPLSGARVSLSLEIQGPGGSSFSSVGGTTAAADGAFTLTNIPPGEYRVSSRGPDAASQEGASQILSVDGSDIEGLTVMASIGGTISGEIVVETDAKFPSPFSRLRIGQRSVDGVVRSSTPLGSQNGAVSEQGSFELSGIAGLQRLTVSGIPEGWILKSIDLNGKDLADIDLNMRSDERWDGVRVILTNRLGTVSGTVSVGRDQQAGTGTVILFHQEPALWLDLSRYVRAIRPSQTGDFEVKGLLAGEYHAIALEYIAENDWYDPEVLQSLVDRSTRFTLKEGEERTLILSLRK